MLLAREFGWTLDEIRALQPSELVAILDELRKMRILDEYVNARNRWGFIAAVFMNGITALASALAGRRQRPKLVKPDDFVAPELKREAHKIIYENEDWGDYINEAKKKGLQVPD